MRMIKLCVIWNEVVVAYSEVLAEDYSRCRTSGSRIEPTNSEVEFVKFFVVKVEQSPP